MSRALKLGAYLHEEATAVHKQQLLQAAAVAGATGPSLPVHVFRTLGQPCNFVSSLIERLDLCMNTLCTPTHVPMQA
jgi:hypothetical protein